jgi:hypothetical protein
VRESEHEDLIPFLLAAASIHAQQIQMSPVASVKSNVERGGLHGKVQTVHTETGLPQPKAGSVAWPWASDVTYDRDGWETEFTRSVWGNQTAHGVIQRDGQRLIRTEFDAWEDYDPHSEITTYDSAGRPIERLIKNHDGTLRERTTRTYNENGILETTYDGSGHVIDSYVRHTAEVQSGNQSTSETYTDNELESRTIVGQSNNATNRQTTNYGRDGKVSSMTSQESTNGITNFALTDKFGNAVTDTRDGSGQTRVHTFSDKTGSTKSIYDADGRIMRMERYAANGKLLNAFVYSYQNDEQGNWIRQTKSKELSDGQSLVTEIVSRRITYY